MKRIITLLLLIAATFGFKAQAQTGTTCNADFSFSYLNSYTVKFTPVIVGDSFNTVHYWKFGDGNIASMPLPTHTYTSAGTYSVTHILVRLNPNGNPVCADSVVKTLIIQSAPCNLQANYTWMVDSANFSKIYFSNTTIVSSASDSISWNFGDGTPILSGLMSNPAIANPVHFYPNAGTYTVCLRVKRNNNTTTTPCVSEICKTVVIVQPCNLVAGFTSQPDTVHPLHIKFTNTSAPVAVSDSIRWTFGDGSSVSGVMGDPNAANPTHIYAQGGTYTICIRIKRNTNTTGTACVREFCKTIVVVQPCNFQVNFSMHRDSVTPRKVYFTNLTAVTTATATAIWSFGDGTSATAWNAMHEYTQPGTYIACLTVQTAPNCIKSKCDTIVIPASAPDCKNLSKFTFEKVAGDNQKYKFTPDYINSAVQYTWTFGDGTGSKDIIATHRYAQPGVYIVCLTAWSGPNCASTTCKEVRVLPQMNCDSVRVNYSWQKDPLVPNKLYFYASSNNPILDQTWTITRLNPATTPPVILHQNNPAYVFSDTGLHRVCLKAITLGGCVKEYCSVIRIENVMNGCLLQAFPTPASNLINVIVPLTQPEMIHAYVYNSSNLLVREKHIQGLSGNNTVTINVEGLPTGLYTIKVIYGGKTCYARFNKL